MKNKNIAMCLLLMVSVFLVMNLVAADGYVNNVSLTSPADNAWTDDLTPSMVFNVTGNQTYYNCTLYMNGTQKAQNTSSFNATGVTLTSSALTDGAHSWYVNCTNVTTFQSYTRTLKIDSTDPTAILTRSPTSSVVNYLGYITATCSGTDTNTLTYMIYMISPKGAVSTSTSSSHRFSGSELKTLGTHKFNCTVTDPAGNTGNAAQLSFKVDDDTTEQEAVAAGIVTNNITTTIKQNMLPIIAVILIVIIAIVILTKKKK